MKDPANSEKLQECVMLYLELRALIKMVKAKERAVMVALSQIGPIDLDKEVSDGARS